MSTMPGPNGLFCSGKRTSPSQLRLGEMLLLFGADPGMMTSLRSDREGGRGGDGRTGFDVDGIGHVHTGDPWPTVTASPGNSATQGDACGIDTSLYGSTGSRSRLSLRVSGSS